MDIVDIYGGVGNILDPDFWKTAKVTGYNDDGFPIVTSYYNDVPAISIQWVIIDFGNGKINSLK